MPEIIEAPPPKVDGKPDWEAIRAAYIAGGVTLKQLSERFQVPLRTIERRSAIERWRTAPGEHNEILAVAAREVAVANGRTLGLTAIELIDRTITIYKRLVDRVEGYLDQGDLSVAEFRNLVAGWKDLTMVGREAFGLNRESTLLNAPNQGRIIDIKPVIPDSPAAIPASDPPPSGPSE